jgi:pyruvate,water dikinase
MGAVAARSLIHWFGDPACAEVQLAGGKGASLSRMALAGLPVPPGFVVSATAFARFLEAHEATGQILEALERVDPASTASLEAASREIRALIRSLEVPLEIASAIAAAYAELGGGEDVPVAVRSSAIAEDSHAASYAGQQETYLNVAGERQVIERVRDCWASLFSPHALFYRSEKGSLHDLAIAVVVQRMVVPDKSGVLFTADPVQRRRDCCVIEATWGFGEAVVSGLVVPDNYLVARADRRLLRAFVPAKTAMLVRDPSGDGLRQEPVPRGSERERVLTDEEIRVLTELAERVEAYFGTPQDIEWAIEAGEIYLLQSRPITTL